MELTKTELTPTLKVKAERPTDIAFKKPFQASIKEVKEVETSFGKKLLMGLSGNETEFSVFLNAKSKNMLIDAYGSNTENWKGKLVDLKKETDEKFKKEMIVCYPIK